MKIIDYDLLPEELKLLIPKKEILLVFGDKGVVVNEFTISQYTTFLKYYTQQLKKYEDKINTILKERGIPEEKQNEEKSKITIIQILPEILKETRVDEQFKHMFKELYPNLDEALIESMTNKQLFYNIQTLFKENFLLITEKLPEKIGQDIISIKGALGLL